MRFTTLLLILGAAATGCASGSATTSPAAATPASADSAVLTVHGMGCPLCANNVDSQLMKVPGVEAVTIDLGTGQVTARVSATDPPTEQELAKAIADSGFTLVNIQMP